MEDEIYAELKVLEENEARNTERVLKVCKEGKTKAWCDELDHIIEDSGYTDRFEIVAEPEGEKQKEDGPLIAYMWVDQYRNGGYTGDDFAGSICIEIMPNKYLKFHYNC